MQNVPGDERPAQRRDEPEGNERRHRQSSGDEREHADPGGEPSGADPTRSVGGRATDEVDEAQAKRDVREEVEREPTAERNSGDRGKRLPTWSIVILNPSANSTIPVIIGRCR